MIMNHLMIYYLEIAFCIYASSTHEGECDLSTRDQKHISGVGTPGSVSGREKLPFVPASFVLFSGMEVTLLATS